MRAARPHVEVALDDPLSLEEVYWTFALSRAMVSACSHLRHVDA
jgi:hypothetical protein